MRKRNHSKRVRPTRFALLFIGLCLSCISSAQFCDGNLGENLFVDGNFGSGVVNIPTQDPNFSPALRYVRQGPPNDGEYTITNDLSRWNRNFPSWLQISDNSGDAEGYMMVVNASVQPSLFFSQEINGLCENTVYSFSADIFNLIRSPGYSTYIDPDVTFLIDGDPVFTTGDVPKSQMWETYQFEFTAGAGQSSVELSLRNNAPGGFGNDLALDNISFRACGPTAEILPQEISFACEDGAPIVLEATIIGDQYDTPSIQWQQSFDEGVTWVSITGATSLSFTHTDNRSGFYYYRYLLANGTANLSSRTCRVVSNIKRLYYQPKEYFVRDTVCEGLSYTVGASRYDQTGTYVDSLVSFFGCDSIVTTELLVLPDPGISSNLLTTDPSCSYTTDGTLFATDPVNGVSPYTFELNGESISDGQQQVGLSAGVYQYRISDRYGCTFSTSFQLKSPPTFVIDLGPDLSLDLGEEASVSLQTFGGTVEEIAWNPTETVDCDPPCTTFTLQPSRSVQILAEATNENGCVSSDSLFLEVLKVRKHFFPTAFSPNGDGVNDYFTGFGARPNVQLIEQLVIVDRWGNTLFRRSNLMPNDQLAGWNGIAAGKALDEGVYVYTARILYFDGETAQVSGEVTLVR